MLTIKKKTMTLEDCLKLKKYYPYNFLRTVSKHVDLSLVFFAQAPTLSSVLKEAGLDEKACDNIANTLHLDFSKQNLDKICYQGKKTLSVIDAKFMIIAKALHKAFFDLYPGLQERCEREHAFLYEHGYHRTWQGAIRHLPEVLYFTVSGKGQPTGMDKELHSKEFAGLKNQSSNSGIQTLEVYHAIQLVHNLHHNFKKNKMKSKVWNYVHDSVDLYTHKKEHESAMSIVRKSVDVPRYPEFGIRCEMDGDVSDLSLKDKNGKQSQYYKFGKEIKLVDNLDSENEKNGTKFIFEDTIRR